MATILKLLGLSLLATAAVSAAEPGADVTKFDHDHPQLTRVLQRHVKDGGVDYAALQRDRSGLDAYLTTLSAVKEEDFNEWTEAEKLAFQINAYNGFTLRLILDHYPVDGIKSIGGWFSNPWKMDSVNLFGRKMTLDHLEHGRIRVFHNEPRIHFALVCAAQGCPPLRASAYTAANLDSELNEQARAFLRQSAKNRYDPATKTLHLSPIFKWYRDDFETDGRTLVSYVAQFLPEETARAVRAEDVELDFTDYDWSLNDRQ